MQFKKFVGYSDNFDFYYLYDKFDFDKFDVKWLLNLNERNIVKICENDDVKLKLRMVVAASIRDKKLSPSDERKLVRILTCNLC